MRISSSRAPGASLALLLAIACAPASQHAYVAPSRATIISTTEETQGPPARHVIYIENRSTVPVTVFSVSLSGCENVKQQCSPHPVKIRVAPGQREVAIRVEPVNAEQGFGYHFGFSWNADSAGMNALNALASNGSADARGRLTAMERADSLEREGGGFHELSRTDFAALAGRVASMRARSDSLFLEPGEKFDIDRMVILLADSQGVVLGRTHWVRYQVNSGNAISFVPPGRLIARNVGRAVVRFQLADEAAALVGNPGFDALEVPIVVGFAPDPHAPTFEGIVTDAESDTPLSCARVALEDSLQTVVARGRTDATGTFVLRAPHPGSYRVDIEVTGWSPVHGPLEPAAADADVQHRYPVRFTEKLLATRYVDPDEYQSAYPTAVAASTYALQQPAGAKKKKTTKPGSGTIIRSVSLRGSASMPILNVVGNAQPGTTWAQFVVDSSGQVRPGSIALPATADSASVESVNLVLPHVRFSPARESRHPTCELVRMQVNFSPR
jgi:hypothetical protein